MHGQVLAGDAPLLSYEQHATSIEALEAWRSTISKFERLPPAVCLAAVGGDSAQYNGLLAEEARAEAQAWVKAGSKDARRGVRDRLVRLVESRRLEAVTTSGQGAAEEDTAVSLFASYQRHVATWRRLKHQTAAGMAHGGARDDSASAGGASYASLADGSEGAAGEAAAAEAVLDMSAPPPSFNGWLSTFADPTGALASTAWAETVDAASAEVSLIIGVVV